MENPFAALKSNSGQAGEGLKSLLSMLSAGKALTPGTQPVPQEQLGAELAYKLAQASAKAKDRERLRIGVVALLDALQQVNLALSGEEAPSDEAQ